MKHLQATVSVYCQANIKLEKKLLVYDLFLIHLIQLCQRYKNNIDAYCLQIKNKIYYNV